MNNGEWDSQKAFDRYLYDYMLKRNMLRTAAIFQEEANVDTSAVVINPPDGFLAEWWSMFWEMFSSRENNGSAAQVQPPLATEVVAQGAVPEPPQPDPVEFGTLLNNLFSTMPVADINQHAPNVLPSIIANPAMNQETAAMGQPSIPNLMNQPAVTLLQPPNPNTAMNQQAMGGMPPSDAILDSLMNQQAMGMLQHPSSLPFDQQAMGVLQHASSLPFDQQAMGVLQHPNSLPFDQQAMGVMQHPNTVPFDQQAMGTMQPPSSISLSQLVMGMIPPPNPIAMNQQAMGMMHPPNQIMINQQAMGIMHSPSSVPMNQQAVVLMPPSNPFPMNNPGAMGMMQGAPSIPNLNQNLNQRMPPQVPNELRGEPVSLLLRKMYEQDCLRRSVRDLTNRAQLDAARVNPVLVASSSRSSYPPQQPHPSQQNAQNFEQQWQPQPQENHHPMAYEGPSAIVLNSRAEIPDAAKNKGIQQNPTRGHSSTGVGLLSSGLRNRILYPLVSSPNQQHHSPSSRGHHLTGVSILSPGLGNQLPCPPRLEAETSQIPTSSAAGSSRTPVTTVVIDDLSGKEPLAPNDAEQQGDKLEQQKDENAKKRKKRSQSQAAGNSLDGKDADQGNSTEEDINAYFADDTEILAAVMGNSNMHRAFQQTQTAQFASEPPEGFSFKEVSSLHSLDNKLHSCHFSTSGKLLVAAGQAKKILLWNLENLSVATLSGHSDIITDVRFQQTTTLFGSSSFDKTVLIWDAQKSQPQTKLNGHSNHVLSLDFHPIKEDLVVSCDSGNDIRFWNINSSSCLDVYEGIGTQARFRPKSGNILAVAKGNYISLLDFDTKIIIARLQGLNKDIRSFCWDNTGDYIAAISEDSARIWLITAGGQSMHDVQHSGNNFASCVFHPGYCKVLAIGTDKSIQIWNPTLNNRTWTYEAHEGKVTALASSQVTETIASASHDQWLKLWKS